MSFISRTGMGMGINWWEWECCKPFPHISSINVDSRCAELASVENWLQANNLVLNHSKSLEIIFADRRQKRSFKPPSLIPAIRWATSIKILAVSVKLTKNLAVTEHADKTVAKCARSVNAIRILRYHGMSTDCIYTIIRSAVVAILIYASSAWWGFTTAADR